MEAVKDYLLSITAAAVICGCVNSIVSENSWISRLAKLLCGLFLVVTAIQPVIDIKVDKKYVGEHLSNISKKFDLSKYIL